MAGAVSHVLFASCLATCLLSASTGAAAAQIPPYTLETRQEIVLTTAGLAMLIASVPVQSSQEPLTPAEIDALDPADINPFDRPATEQWSPNAKTGSDVLVMTLLASPVVLAATESGRGQSTTIGVMYLETVLLTNGVTQLLKGLTHRTRPYAYNDDPAISEETKQDTRARRSFPSGHTANAFAAAVFMSSSYSRLHPHSGARTWVWVGSLTAASAVGYLRYRAGKHFPTDIIAGAILGASTGYLVPKLHASSPVYVVPSDGGLAVGATLQF